MKRFIIILSLALLWAGCEKLDHPSWNGYNPGRGSGRGSAQGTDSTAAAGPAVPDTLLWACVVKVPDGYDWRRDSLAGRFGGELLFYRNGSPVLDIPLDGTRAVSADPGTHHIIGGRLYTECTSAGALHILRDGEPLLNLPESGFLKGLLPREDGSVWTLVCNPAEGSLSLRRDGESVARIERGIALGGLGEGRPALYEDAGRVCFTYSDGENLFGARDGAVSAVTLPEGGRRVEDFRWRNGTPVTLWRKGGSSLLMRVGAEDFRVDGGSREMRLVEAGGELYAFGMSDYVISPRAIACNADRSRKMYFNGTRPWLHGTSDGLFTVQARDPLRISFGAAVPNTVIPGAAFEDALVFSDECVGSVGPDPWLGVSVPGGRPLLVRGTAPVGEFPFEGYITAVEVQITNL